MLRLALAFTFLRIGAKGNGSVGGLCGGEIMRFESFQFFLGFPASPFFLMSDDRIVPRRTDASAETFWCREYPDHQISPTGRILPPNNELFPSAPVLGDMPRTLLPFQVQVRPTHLSLNRRTPQVHLPPARTSRSIERIVYKEEIKNLENITPNMRQENERLKRELTALKTHFNSVLRINHLLAREMATQARNA